MQRVQVLDQEHEWASVCCCGWGGTLFVGIVAQENNPEQLCCEKPPEALSTQKETL